MHQDSHSTARKIIPLKVVSSLRRVYHTESGLRCKAMENKKVILHYFYDPFCGWCYGAGPLLAAAHNAGISIQLHAGGLVESEQGVDPLFVDHIKSNSSSISSLTGQRFGKAYLNGLLTNPDTILWSQPAVDAILAAGKLANTDDGVLKNQLSMLHGMQKAYYVNGQQVTQLDTQTGIARSIDLDEEQFKKKLNPAAASKHIKQTQKLMKTSNISGFPNFLVEREDKTMHKLDHSKYYGKPDKFLKAINAAV